MMGDFVHSQFNLHCTNLTLNEIKTITLARSVSGFVCSLIALSIISLLLYFKSYKSTLQRLFLLFTIDTLAVEILLGLNIEHYFQYGGQEKVCSAMGFLIQWTGSMTYWCSLGITLVLALTVFQKISGNIAFGTKRKKMAECLLVLFVVFLPLLHIWPPFLNNNYGLEFAYCWIKEKNENCSNVGESDRLQFFIISQTIESICVVVTLALTLLYCVLRYKYRHVGTTQVMTLLCQTLLLMAFLVFHWLINVVTQIIYTIPIKEYAQWMYTDAIPIPFLYLLVPFGFLVHLYAVRNASCCTGLSRCCRSKRLKERQKYSAENSETRPTSQPINARSDTYWSVPYTNEFTSVPSSSNQTDRDHLIPTSTSDTGYDSFVNYPT